MEADYGMLLARTELRRRQARRDLVVRVPARPARGHDPPAARDHRPRDVQRGVLRRRDRRRRGPRRRREQRVGGHADHAHVRALGHRRRAAPWPTSRRPARRAGSSTCGRATPRSAGRRPPRARCCRSTSCSSWRASVVAPTTRSSARSWPGSSSTRGRASGRRSARWGRWRAGGASASPTWARSPRRGEPSSSAEIALDLLGPDGLLWDPDGPRAGRYAEALVFSVASSIYGGTDQIQRNVIGERALGLPPRTRPQQGSPVPRRARPHEPRATSLIAVPYRGDER